MIFFSYSKFGKVLFFLFNFTWEAFKILCSDVLLWLLFILHRSSNSRPDMKPNMKVSTIWSWGTKLIFIAPFQPAGASAQGSFLCFYAFPRNAAKILMLLDSQLWKAIRSSCLFSIPWSSFLLKLTSN